MSVCLIHKVYQVRVPFVSVLFLQQSFTITLQHLFQTVIGTGSNFHNIVPFINSLIQWQYALYSEDECLNITLQKQTIPQKSIKRLYLRKVRRVLIKHSWSKNTGNVTLAWKWLHVDMIGHRIVDLVVKWIFLVVVLLKTSLQQDQQENTQCNFWVECGKCG